jgi:hypothetical protein
VPVQPRVGVDRDRGSDPLEHRQIVVAVAVEVAGRQVDAVALGPALGERDLVVAEAERGRPAGEHAALDLELGRQDMLDADAAGDRPRRVLGRTGREARPECPRLAMMPRSTRREPDLRGDVLAVPDLALRDHLGFRVAA